MSVWCRMCPTATKCGTVRASLRSQENRVAREWVPVSEFSGGRHPGHATTLFESLNFFKAVPLRGVNPDWARDELILALDFYLKHRPNPPDKASKDIHALSQRLNGLGAKLLLPSLRAESFRNPNGVYMKLMNFRHSIPSTRKKGRRD